MLAVQLAPSAPPRLMSTRVAVGWVVLVADAVTSTSPAVSVVFPPTYALVEPPRLVVSSKTPRSTRPPRPPPTVALAVLVEVAWTRTVPEPALTLVRLPVGVAPLLG